MADHRVIRDERRDPRKSNLTAAAAVADAARRSKGRKVDSLTTQRTPFPAGDPRSISSTKVNKSELDAELISEIEAGGGSGGAADVEVPYTAGVALRSVVFINAVGQAERATAIGTALQTRPVRGVVAAIDSPSPGQCVVRVAGPVGGFSGLTPGATYVASRAAGLALRDDDTGSSDYPVGGDTIQGVGVAASSSMLVVHPWPPIGLT